MVFMRSFLALMLFISVNIHSAVINFQDNQQFNLDMHQATLGTDFQAFKSWILALNPPSQKKALIENTILNVHYPTTPTIDWAKAIMSNQDFDHLLASPITGISLVVTPVAGVYNYSPNNAFWVDFANASTFGGGFRKNGNVQEERMFMEFPQLAQLAYAKRNQPILPVSNNCNLGAIKYNLAQGIGTPEVHTGNWGAGAFKNSVSMMTAIQILAGAMAQMQKDGVVYGIHLFFHLTRAGLVSNLTNNLLTLLQQGKTPLDVLNYLMSLQADDPSTWGPQPC